MSKRVSFGKSAAAFVVLAVVGISTAWSFGWIQVPWKAVPEAREAASFAAQAVVEPNVPARSDQGMPAEPVALRPEQAGSSAVAATAGAPAPADAEGGGFETAGSLTPDEQAALAALAGCHSGNGSGPNPGDPPPGLWWNPHRWGTGWTYAFDTSTQRMQVVWHTFYPRVGGDQTWLVSDWAPVRPGSSSDNSRIWSAPLFRTRFGEWGVKQQVGSVAIGFPEDSATRASVVWHWNTENDDPNNKAFGATECLFAYNVDGPVPQVVGPSLSAMSPDTAGGAGTGPAPQGPYYTGIWFDPSTPGFGVEVASVNRNTEMYTLSIYDTNTKKPLWLWAQMGPQPAWPSPDWIDSGAADTRTEVVVGYRTAKYDMTKDDCSEKGTCVDETPFPYPANYFGRAYHRSSDGSLNDAVMGLNVKVVAPIGITWPPASWPLSPPDSDLTGCPKGTQICRPMRRATDKENITVSRQYCDLPSATSTCQVTVSWNASVLGVVQRINADTLQLMPRGTDGGIVGGGIWGSAVETLSADEHVIYRLIVANRQVADRTVRAAYTRITVSPQPCVIPAGQSACPVTVSWVTPDAPASSAITVYRYQVGGSPYGFPPPIRPIGSAQDSVPRGATYFYVLRRGDVEVASTRANPTTPVDAYVKAMPTLCSVPLNQSTCPIGVEWLANSASAVIQRLDRVGSAAPVNVGSGGQGSTQDNLPPGSRVQYVVKLNGTVQAQSGDASAIRSTLTANATSCIVLDGQPTCTIKLGWTSTSAALVERVDEVGGGRSEVGRDFTGVDVPDALAPGSRVHYELTIGGVLHAITPAIIAIKDTEGGDASTGSAEAPPPPAAFVEPSLDADSDAIGAIAGDFRVDESGAATYRMPLAVPPGAGGLAPTLAIVYRSNAGEGLLGTGFSLEGTSAIAPCRPSIEAGDANAPSADPSEFCLDGQRLLLVGGTHRQVNAEYRTEIETFQRVKLARVEQVSLSGKMRDAYVFTVDGKDGSVRTYGGSAGTMFGRSGVDGVLSRDAGLDAVDTVKAQGWLQTELKDAAGNALTYVYDPATNLGERLLRSITYAGGSVILNYQVSPRTETIYSALGERRQTQLLAGIDIRGAGNTSLRYYQPEYNLTQSNLAQWQRYRPQMVSLKECDRQGGTCYPATTFAWAQAAPGNDEVGGRLRNDTVQYKLGDWNGDKRTDFWWTNKESGAYRMHVATSVADASGNPTVAEVYTMPGGVPDGFGDDGQPLWEVLDVNGDGRDDAIYAMTLRNGALCQRGDHYCATHPTEMRWSRWRVKSDGSGVEEGEEMFHVIVDPDKAAQYAQSLSDPVSLAPDAVQDVLRLLGSSIVADVDGDGLSDIVFRAPDGMTWVALARRKAVSDPADPIEFKTVLATFQDENGNDLPNDRCGFPTASLMRREENFTQAVDFDGDGRADLRFVIDAKSCLGDKKYRLDVFLSKGQRSSDGKFVFRAFQPFGNVVVTAGDRDVAGAARKLRTVDVNGDGLADLVYLADDGAWHYRLGGPYSAATDACVAGCSMRGYEASVQLLDFDGDGKLDFWMPKRVDHNDKYEIHVWKGNDWASDGVQTFYEAPNNTWIQAVADFDGDGIADNFFLQRETGAWHLQRASSHHRPRGVVTEIANGLRAKTTISYAPLTFPSVYQRDYDAPFMLSGRGSPVFDVVTPTYVVQWVNSSAPIPNDADHVSRVSYRYAGLKVQAGGRGSLGFRRISTTDSQTSIEVDSYYKQRFPYTGLAEMTETRNLSNTLTSGNNACVLRPDSAACMYYVPPCAAGMNETCNNDLPYIGDATKTIKSTIDGWQWRSAAGTGALGPYCEGVTSFDVGLPGTICPDGRPAIAPEERDRRQLAAARAPIFLAHIDSLANSYDLQNGAGSDPLSSESTQLPIAGYDDYGNPRTSRVVKSGGGVSVTVDSQFDYRNDAQNWKLGRLQTATVSTTRTTAGVGASTNVRRSSFKYNERGLLVSERVEGLKNGAFDPAAPTVTTYYEIDARGNRTQVATCSDDVAENNCRVLGAGGGGGYAFHPASAATVMRYSRSTYDALGRFADVTTEAFSAVGADGAAQERESQRVLSRNEAGDPLSVRNANGVTASIRYGRLGRKRFTASPEGATTRWDAFDCNRLVVGSAGAAPGCPGNMGLSYAAVTTQSGAPTSVAYYDLLGRPTVTMVQGFNTGSWIATIKQYDARGNVARVSDPFHIKSGGSTTQRSGPIGLEPAPGETLYWTETTYDVLNRPTKIVRLGDNATTTIEYRGLTTTTTLPLSGSGQRQARTEIRNGLGEVFKVGDSLGGWVETRYDAAGNVVEVVHGSATTQTKYDSLGRKFEMTDPDSGTWTYVVNGKGETISQRSPRGTCIANDYDGRGRLWRRRDFGASCGQVESQAFWRYDTASYGVGALAEESNPQVTRRMTYDGFGRLVQTDTALDGKSYTEQQNFDPYGRPFQHFFTAPDLPTTGERSVYTDQGHLAQVRSAFPTANGMYPVYREIQSVNARGQVTKWRGAAQAEYTQDRIYDPITGRMKRQQALSAAGVRLQDFSYDYDAIGNLVSRTNGREAIGLIETFGYDNLQRLTSSSVLYGGQTVFARSQVYDGLGNITNKNDAGMTYIYGSRPSACQNYVKPGPHAVSDVGAVFMCYDGNGNLVKQVNRNGTQPTEREFAYTAADQASDIRDYVSNNRVGFAYGPNRERIRRLDYASRASVTAETVVHWVGDAQIRYRASATNSASTLVDVRRSVGPVQVVQSGSLAGRTHALKRQIVLRDVQGSTDQVLGAMSLAPVNDAAPMSFDAWGGRRDGVTWATTTPWRSELEQKLRASTTQGYTGHEMAESVGIIHMNGRIYDPHFARFLQADPFVQSPQDLQSWNRYSYVLNNPMAYTDPSGYFSTGDLLRIAAAVAITVYSSGTAWGASWGLFGTSVTAGQAWGAILVGGFASGAVQTGSLKGAVTGAVSAGVFYGVGTGFSNVDWAYKSGQMTLAGHAAKALADGAAGGVMEQLRGGSFGHGFMSAGFSSAFSPAPEGYEDFGVTAAKTMQAAVIGGTASALGGGKFANGAVTGAFSYAFGSMVRRQPSPGSDGNQLSLEDAKTGVWPSNAEARNRLMYLRFSLTWLHEQGALPSDFNFAFEGEGFLDAVYNDTVKEHWASSGNALGAEAPLNAQGGPAGPIQFYRGGLSTNDVGNFRTYSHEVLHRSPVYSIPYMNGQQSIDSVHAAMRPAVEAARASYIGHQAAIDNAWEAR